MSDFGSQDDAGLSSRPIKITPAEKALADAIWSSIPDHPADIAAWMRRPPINSIAAIAQSRADFDAAIEEFLS